MFEASYRVVLMVRKPLPGDTFEEALAAARKLVATSLRGNLLTDQGRVKGEIEDWGFYLVSVDEDGGYRTE